MKFILVALMVVSTQAANDFDYDTDSGVCVVNIFHSVACLFPDPLCTPPPVLANKCFESTAFIRRN